MLFNIKLNVKIECGGGVSKQEACVSVMCRARWGAHAHTRLNKCLHVHTATRRPCRRRPGRPVPADSLRHGVRPRYLPH